MNVKSEDKKVYFLFGLIALVGGMACIYIYRNLLAWPPIRSDGQGYYMYLPSVFVFHDIGMNFLDQVQDVGSFAKTYFESASGSMVDKYTVGTAVLQLPFFLMAHFLTSFFSPYQPDGFSILYQVFNVISACFYYFLGSVFAYKCTVQYTERRSAACIAICIITFGSNLFHYFTYDASFSHIYSYFLISLFCYLVISHEKKGSKLSQFEGGLCLGLITITRVPNIIIMLYYILYNVFSLETFKKRVAKIVKISNWIWAAIGMGIAIFPQILYWYLVTGSPIINSYSFGGNTFDQGFSNWNNPQILKVLFSVQKGIFFWCPILLIALIGYFWGSRLKKIKLGMCTSFCALVYVTSSWWTWCLGGGYSHRAFVDIMIFFIIPMAVVLEKISQLQFNIRMILYITIFAAVIWNVLSMYAYWRGVLSAGMNSWEDVTTMLQWYINFLN